MWPVSSLSFVVAPPVAFINIGGSVIGVGAQVGDILFRTLLSLRWLISCTFLGKRVPVCFGSEGLRIYFDFGI